MLLGPSWTDTGALVNNGCWFGEGQEVKDEVHDATNNNVIRAIRLIGDIILTAEINGLLLSSSG